MFLNGGQLLCFQLLFCFVFSFWVDLGYWLCDLFSINFKELNSYVVFNEVLVVISNILSISYNDWLDEFSTHRL